MTKGIVNRDHNLRVFLIIGTAWMFDAMDVGLLSYIMPLVHKEWALTAAQTGMLSSVSTVGMILGAFILGHLADRMGRKKTLLISLLIFSIGNAFLAFSPNFYMFLVIRFVVGIGLGGELPVAATFISDLYQGKVRRKMLILADSFWALGWLVAALLSFLLSPYLGWRGLLLLTVLSALVALLFRKHIQEDNVEYVKDRHNIDNWRHAFTRTTPLLWLAWLMVMFSYYGMFMWLPSILINRGNTIVTSFGYSVIMIIAQLPGYFGAAWLSGKIKIKYVFAIYMLGTAGGAILFGSATSLFMTLLAGCILSFFNLGAYGAIIALTPEQYHMTYRGTMTGLAQGIGRIGAVVGPLLVGIFLDNGTSIDTIFILFMVSLVIGAGSVLLLPDQPKEH